MYKINVRLKHNSYQIIIKTGLIKQIGKRLKSKIKSTKIAIVTDKKVGKLYGKQVVTSLKNNGFKVKIIQLT